MEAPRFYWPIKPLRANQLWGVLNPTVYSQFGFTRHNGIDMALAPDKTISAPVDATVVRKGFQPNGGGIFVGLISEPIDFPAFTNTTPDGAVVSFAPGTYRILVDFLHCESITVNEGDKVKAGDLIAIGDNTGFSTGPHCHTQWRRVTWDGKVINTFDKNDANNSFDPTQFFIGIYAADLPSLINTLRQQVAALTLRVAQLIKGRQAKPAITN
ncbi:hypothetical protein UNPF46_08540 [Bradyrhizobium sp. UNPF46]|uniref:M23 family metallopeptidase n=1 Tax=Bradyrhizobium sp. UNPF46 TaxID=1141168 RepID=UPI001152D03C|nr:M23 family metallopeptidase [Bradyrhizobium sp. UNPF46]TQF41158.1 hypothetical protein UNPF46_08540 [Bradyrhizobium sp. UNPF46]